jgi:hypothetical protein
MTRTETTITHGKVQFYHFTGSGKVEEQITININFLLPSRQNYPYDSKVLKAIMFTLKQHVSADTGPSSGQQRT